MVNIIYWSGTGNTEAMANAIAEGVAAAGGQAEIIPVAQASLSDLDADVVLFGCPAMGSEELEEGEFEPFFASAEGKLGGKKIGLFGSYEWAEGEWMRTWQARAEADGAVMLAEGLAVYGMPDEDGLEKCRALGRLAANASA